MTMRDCFKGLIRFNLRLYLLVASLSVIYTSLPLLFGLILRAFFNTLSGEATVQFDIWTLAILYFVVQVGLQLAELGFAGANAYHYFLLRALLRVNLFRTMLQSPAFQPAHGSGEVLNRFNEDTSELVDPVVESAAVAGQVVSTLLALWIMVQISWQLTLVAILPTLAIVLMARRVQARIHAYRQRAREATGAVTEFLGDVLNGVQALQVAGTEPPAVRRFERLSENRRSAVVQDQVLGRFFSSMNAVAIHLTIGVILLIAAQWMRAGHLTVGDFVLFVSYITAGEGSVAGLAQWIGEQMAAFKRADVSLTRLSELLPAHTGAALVMASPLYLRGSLPDAPQVVKGTEHRLDRLQVRGLTYFHPETGRGIAGVDLDLRRGTRTVITGRIGAGKSTLLQVLLGLLPAERGEIRWNGAVVENPQDFFVPPRCAYAPQAPRLFSESLRYNVLLGLPEDQGNLASALHTAVLEPDLLQMEAGLETVVGPRGVRLSGGQILRTAAARMFVRAPELMVFDDLSSALDVETERVLWERVFAHTDATYLIVSHRRTVLQQADWIVVLKDGKVEAEGRLDALLTSSAEMQALWQDHLVEQR